MWWGSVALSYLWILMPQDSTPTFVRSEMNNRSVLVSNEFVQVVGFVLRMHWSLNLSLTYCSSNQVEIATRLSAFIDAELSCLSPVWRCHR